MVECNLAKVEVEGSNPFSRLIFDMEEKGFEESRVLMSCDASLLPLDFLVKTKRRPASV